MRSQDLLLDFADAVQRVAAAEHATICLHMEPLERQAVVLASRDAGSPVPELANEAAAWELVSRHDVKVMDGQCVTVLPSSDPDCTLLRIAVSRMLAQPESERRPVDERRRKPGVRTAPPCDGAIWIGLRRAQRVDQVVEELQLDASGGARDHSSSASVIDVCFRAVWSVYYLSSLLQNPVTQLPGRKDLQLFLKRAIAAARRDRQAIALMLINPDDFTMINHRYNRRTGDVAVRQVAERLEGCLRNTDGAFHHGGAVFAAVLPATEPDECRAVAEKVRSRLTSGGYVDGSVELTFSIGAALAMPGDLAKSNVIESELTQRADAALNAAKLSGGGRIIVSDLSEPNNGVDASSNPLNGIFAADTEKDYRNMLLLWESVALISTQTEPKSIAAAFVDRLAIGFRPDRAALFSKTEDRIDTLASSIRDDSAPDGRVSQHQVELDASGRRLVFEAMETRQVARSKQNDSKSAGFSAYAVPLIAGDTSLGCLYLDAGGRRMQLDSSDVIFLNALATQMAVAMDRADLAARWICEKDRESRLLREEVRGLRQVLHHTKIVYQSEAMHSVMETLRKVAPSDATVLIVGESGTGKEMLAQSVHELSDRRAAPLVVFDCGAVAHSLLEAELFGHKKGAFTGAESASAGRIAQADGGTLFLDEIGELPLAVQSKLLRFVQEKEFSPVGSGETRRVDVRIVAATNRRLQEEVAAGRFRADLYYRLRVISVNAVPLRERTDDILPLARFFLEKFATQYSVPANRFSSAAENKMQHHSWPGNVRELQNCVLRAVLTKDADVLEADAIELFAESSDGGAFAAGPGDERVTREIAATNLRPPVAETLFEDDPWSGLQLELERQVADAVTQNKRRPVPIGRWLNEDLVLTAYDECDSVARKAANLVGVAESTFRRQLDKANAGALAGMNYRPDSWEPVRPLVRRIIAHAHRTGQSRENLLERARDVLLTGVRVKTVARPGAGASLMGISPPTYKRWLQAQEQTS